MMPLSWGKGLVLQSCLVLVAVLIGVLLKNIWIAQITQLDVISLVPCASLVHFWSSQKFNDAHEHRRNGQVGQIATLGVLGLARPVLERYGRCLYCFF